MLVAYFSMEYGLVESLNIYSGGLGILSGDHLKGASDMALNLVGIGLLYQKGYFQQHLSPDGWQTEKSPTNDFYSWPIQPVVDAQGNEIVVQVQFPAGPLPRQGLAAQGGSRGPAAAGHEHPGKHHSRLSRRHRPALWWRHRGAHPPGDSCWAWAAFAR